MKITVVSFYLPPTDRIGAGVQMHMLANAYVSLGHTVEVLSPVTEKDPTATYDLTSVNITGNNRIMQWSRFLAKRQFDSDIVHFGGDDFLVPSNMRSVYLRTFLGSCIAEAKVAASARDKIRMCYLGLTEYISSLRSSLTTVISDDTNRYLPRKAITVPCGVDLESFMPGGTKASVPTILFVGTLDSRKRGRELLNAFVNSVLPRFPDAELWLVRESSSVDIAGVRVFGSVSQEKLIELYQQAWVFCLPSSYEGFGVPYIEAMACGTPVVATPNPGALAVLDGGRFGVLAEIEQLGTSLVSLLSDEMKRKELSVLGLVRANDYDIYKIANRYIEIAVEFAERRIQR